MKSPTSLISIRNAVGAMLALSAIFAVVITSVTLTQERAFVEAQSTDVTVNLSKPTANPQEGSSVDVTVTLGSDATANVDIPLTVTAGTALESTATTNPQNNDYDVPDPSQATVIANNSTGTMRITLVDDAVDEPQESFTVSLGALPDGYTAGDTTSVTIYINDDDNEAPSPTTVTIRVKNADGTYADYNPADNDPSDGRDILTDFVPKSGHVLHADTSEVVDGDQPLTASTTDPLNARDAPSFTYQWIRTNDGSTTVADDADEAISGATSSSYTLTDEDVGDLITVRVWSSDNFGNGNGNYSAAVTDTNDSSVTVVDEGTNGFALGVPSERGAVDYASAKPFIIVGALEPAAGGDNRIEPDVKISADWSGLFKADPDDNNNMNLLGSDGNFITVDLDNDTTTAATKVLFSAVSFAWNRNGSPIESLACGADSTSAEPCGFQLDALDDDTDDDADITYTLVDADVSETITLVATYNTRGVGNVDDDNYVAPQTASISSDNLGRVYSSDKAVGKPAITGITQVGSELTASKGTIADADGVENATYTYKWYHSDDTSIGSGSTYVIKASDAGKTIKVVASFMDDLGDPDMRTSDPTNTVAGSPGMISKIEPGINGVVVSGGDDVTLTVEVYGLQGKMDQSLADAVTLKWTAPDGGSLPDDALGNTEVTYTASSSPGTYTVTAMVSDGDCQPDEKTMREAACSASFEVRVRRSAPPQAEPVAPANPPGDIPTILTDAEGNQYEVFTPVEGGTFDTGEGYSVTAAAGAVPNGEFIGVRMSDDGSASNAGMTHQRYTLGGNMYGVHVVDSAGASASDYVLDEAAEVCVPLPDAFRARISDLALVTINSDGSLTILAANVRLGDGGSASVCGNLSNLPASVAVGSMGAPAAIPTATPVPTPEPPPTGGSAPTSNGMLWVLVLGSAIVLLGGAVAVSARRRGSRSS